MTTKPQGRSNLGWYVEGKFGGSPDWREMPLQITGRNEQRGQRQLNRQTFPDRRVEQTRGEQSPSSITYAGRLSPYRRDHRYLAGLAGTETQLELRERCDEIVLVDGGTARVAIAVDGALTWTGGDAPLLSEVPIGASIQVVVGGTTRDFEMDHIAVDAGDTRLSDATVSLVENPAQAIPASAFKIVMPAYSTGAFAVQVSECPALGSYDQAQPGFVTGNVVVSPVSDLPLVDTPVYPANP